MPLMDTGIDGGVGARWGLVEMYSEKKLEESKWTNGLGQICFVSCSFSSAPGCNRSPLAPWSFARLCWMEMNGSEGTITEHNVFCVCVVARL